MPVAAQRRKHKKKNNKSEYFFDYSLLFIILFLLGFGMLMIYSASSYTAYLEYGDSAQYLKKQLLASILGLIAMTVVANIPYHFWERFAVLAYVVSIAIIPVVLTPLGISSHGARRWFKIPGIPLQVQPAEVAKLCMILFLACLVCKLGKKAGTFKGIVLMFLAPLPQAIMIWRITSNLSSAIIVVGISVLMIFVADPHYKKYLVMGTGAVAGVIALVYAIINMETSEGGFRIRRIAIWLHPETDPEGTGFQTLQALYAIGSGGIWGKGLGQSMQKLNFLPEAQNDMIFSIICEELGLFGAVAVILMFILLLWRMMIIANNAPDLFGAMLVVGVIGHIAIQVILNIAVVTNSIPNTGISLPFISYGGSSVMFLLIEMGLVLSVAKRIQLKEV
ncbi:MAG: cell division protein FtsW [Lachnospiraceae bacterium]|nr:cell division protein FtsW [Lachnospiraceae bacterium]